MIDITRALYPGHPHWPGDAPFKLEFTASMAAGASVNVMKLSASTHLGTHLDAPFHYLPEGGTLKEIPLDILIGEALVIDAREHNPVTPEILAGRTRLPARVLFFTGQPERWERWPENFTSLTPRLIEALAERGVKLVGIDSPGVDASSEDLPVHRACGRFRIAILEGLNLAGVKEGIYQLICLPLNLPEADASPVRAVLLQ